MLLRKWRFSDEIVQAIAGQDRPPFPAPAQGNWLAEALFFASELLPQGIGIPFTPSVVKSTMVLPVNSSFMDKHGLDPSSVEKLLLSTSESFDSIRQTFGA